MRCWRIFSRKVIKCSSLDCLIFHYFWRKKKCTPVLYCTWNKGHKDIFRLSKYTTKSVLEHVILVISYRLFPLDEYISNFKNFHSTWSSDTTVVIKFKSYQFLYIYTYIYTHTEFEYYFLPCPICLEMEGCRIGVTVLDIFLNVWYFCVK